MKEPEAETHWEDQHRDPTEAAVVWSLAAQVVAQHGGDLRGMRRSLGISNVTWVGGGLDVRIANTSVVEQVVNHGDLALMNALWDGEVVALLDFEFAVLGPVEIDLCRLVCEALVSEDGRRSDNDPGAAAFAIAARERDPVHGRALLLGAAVLDQLRDLEI